MNDIKRISSGQLLLGMGMGALLMYILDPQQGRRRRALAREQIVQLGRTGSELVDTKSDELRRRAGRLAHLAHRTDAMVEEARGHGHLPSMLIGAAGVGLAALAMNSRGLRGSGAGMVRGRAIAMEKSIHIEAAPEHLFELWSNYENFPRFMSMVEEVRPLGGDRSHWVVKGPAGTRLEWDSVITERLRGRVLAWRSEPGSTVEHAGRVQFQPAPTGTLMTVNLSYRPPGGVLGHAVASLFGRDPKQDMHADLARMKSFVESGQRLPDAVPPLPQGTGRSTVTTP